ncbi:ESCRT-0 subunit protein hse1, partial [Coemansia asiatica]
MLRSVNGALSSLHASVCDGQQEDLADGANESSEAPDAGRSLALVESIRSRILRVREQVPAAVDGAELEARDQRIAELEQQVLQLKAEIDELKLILADQKNMLDAATQDVAARAMSMDMSISEMSLEQLEHEREDLRREKQQLEDERKRFTEAAIELGTERAELKREREEFENAKLSKTTSELIAGLPETPQWMKSLDTSMATPMILHQLQAANRGTPTNELLAAMALQNAHAAGAPRSPSANSTISPASAAMETHIEGSDDMDDSFDESAVTPAPKRTSTQQSRSTTGTLYRSTGTLRPQSRTTSATPVRPTPTRTPVDVRSGRQPRVCTRPGCAAHAHAHHEHDDNGGSASPLMELKPPVPRFRRKNDPANGSPPASTVRSRMSHGANRRSGAGSSLAERTTSEMQPSENWELIIEVCDRVGADNEKARQCFEVINERMLHRNANVILYTMTLVDSLLENCGQNVKQEVASRAFTTTLTRVLNDKTVHEKVKSRILGSIQKWAFDFRQDPTLSLMEETYSKLRAQRFIFPSPQIPDKIPKQSELDKQKEEDDLQLALALSLSSTNDHNSRANYQSPAAIRNEITRKQTIAAANANAAASGGAAPASTAGGVARRTTRAMGSAPIGGLSTSSTDASVSGQAKRRVQVRALYDFTPTEAGELGFFKNDVIEVLDQKYRDWWKGELRGKSGIFPANFVQTIEDV